MIAKNKPFVKSQFFIFSTHLSHGFEKSFYDVFKTRQALCLWDCWIILQLVGAIGKSVPR